MILPAAEQAACVASVYLSDHCVVTFACCIRDGSESCGASLDSSDQEQDEDAESYDGHKMYWVNDVKNSFLLNLAPSSDDEDYEMGEEEDDASILSEGKPLAS